MNLLLDSFSDAPVAQHLTAEPNEFSTVELEQAEVLRLAVRAATAMREAAQRALKRRKNSAEQFAAKGESLTEAIALEQSALQTYAQYLSEASDLNVHLRPRRGA